MGKYCKLHIEACEYLSAVSKDQHGWYCPKCCRKLTNAEIIEIDPNNVEEFKRTMKRKYCKYHIEPCEYLREWGSFSDKSGWYCPYCNQKLSDDEIIELDAHDVEIERLSMKKKKKRSTVISIAVIILCIITVTCIIPNIVMGVRIHAFNNLYKHHENFDRRIETIYSRSDRYNDRYWRLVSCCGLGDITEQYKNQYTMDNDFVEMYINIYSAEEFIEKLYYIYDKRYPHCESYYVNCGPRTANKALLTALDYAAIELTPFTLTQIGTKGYYTDHPDEVPESKTWQVSGSFYSSTGENVHTQTRTCSMTVTVHGDFFVEHYNEYNYDKGAYEWRNGVFYDELPSWNYRTRDVFYYKGNLIGEQIDGAEMFFVDDTCYLLYSLEECDNKAWHNSRKWKKLG